MSAVLIGRRVFFGMLRVRNDIERVKRITGGRRARINALLKQLDQRASAAVEAPCDVPFYD